MIHEVIRRMISRMVVDLIDTSREQIEQLNLSHPDDARKLDHYVIGFSEEMQTQTLELKQFLMTNLYRHYRVQRMTTKAERVLSALFEAFINDQRILPPDALAHCNSLKEKNADNGIARGVSDYLAGMTDRYAIVEYERIYNPRQLSFANLIP